MGVSNTMKGKYQLNGFAPDTLYNLTSEILQLAQQKNCALDIERLLYDFSQLVRNMTIIELRDILEEQKW